MAPIAELVEQLGSSEQPTAAAARQALFEIVWHAGPAQADARQQAAAALAAELAKDHSARVRDELCRFLSLAGEEDQVATLRERLADAETKEMARWALVRIPGKAATKALIDAAQGGGSTEFRVGAVNSLAGRDGDAALEALATCAKDKDVEVRLAAAEALASHPKPAHDAIIAAAAQDGRAGQRVTRARIRHAEQLAAHGEKNPAKRILNAIAGGDADDVQKAACRRALEQLG